MAKITIMLSTYNGEKYLEEQLRSIYKQNCNCEFCLYVHDDGSNDSTIEILQKWEKRLNITYMKNEVSYGAAYSFWHLLKTAPEADFYAFVDQDDIWDENKIQNALDAISNQNDTPVLWVSNCRTIDSDGKVINERYHRDYPIFTVASQLICGSMQGCSMVFNHKLYNYLKESDIQIVPMHDLVVMIYGIIYGVVVYEDKPLFSYRQHENNVVSKARKNVISKVVATYKLWFGKYNKNLTSKFASEILRVCYDDLDVETVLYLEAIVASVNDIKSRIYVLGRKQTVSVHKRGLNSFKIRMMLGLI